MSWPSFLPSLATVRLCNYAQLQCSIVLKHDNGETRIVRAERALRSPPRIEVWWGNGAGMYVLDLVSNKLLRAEHWHARRIKDAWLSWFAALNTKKEG